MSASNDKPNEDLPQTVRHRLSELPDDVWAGELADVECAHCAHNSWCESEAQLGYHNHWAHGVEAYECLNCGATGGRVTDLRNDTPLGDFFAGCMVSTNEPDWGIDPDNPPWADDGDSE